MAVSPDRGPANQDSVEAMADLSRDQLIDRWTRTHKRRPPKGISRTLLERSAVYQAQVKAHGGLGSKTQRTLRAALTASKHSQTSKPASTAKPSLEPGMRLVREWNGHTYCVDVIEGGFVWDGRVYRSLSAIARNITGARWSGPRFFGL